MRELDKKLIENLGFLRKMLKEDCSKAIDDIKAVNYKDGSIPDYTNETQVAYYMMKYGKYYALEYYWMYDLALRVLSSKTSVPASPVVYSFGCGSMLDGLSLLYAHSKLLRSANCNFKDELYYRGIDIIKWPEQGNFEEFLKNLGEDKIRVKTFLDVGMVKFWQEMKTFSANILAFPKMLSENLDEGNEPIISQFTNNLKNATLKQNNIILCISYRGRKTFDVDNALVEKIVSAMEQKGYNCDPFDKGIYGNWICNDYFVLQDSKKMVFMSKDCSIDYDKAYSDFSVPKEVADYLIEGIQNDGRNYDSEFSFRMNPRIRIDSNGGTCIQVLPFKKVK